MSCRLKKERKVGENIIAGTVLNVLSLEDSVRDFEIIREQLIDAGYHLNISRVEKEKEFESSIRGNQYDIILADFKLPEFDAFGALRLCNEICPYVPFICVSGTIGEETAIELIKQGAVDYVLKDRLARLPFAIKRALDEAKEKKAKLMAEEALRESEALFRKLFENHAAVKLILDPDTGNIIDANKAAAVFYGWSREQLKQMKIQEINTLSPEEVKKEMEKVMAKKKLHFEFLHRRADGSVRDVDVFSTVIESNKRKRLHSIVYDISERKRAEEELKESEKKYRLLADNVDDVIFVLDMNLNYTYISPSIKSLRGYEPEEVLKQTTTETLTPTSWDLAMRTLSEIIELEKIGHGEINKSQILQLEMNRKDGTTVWTEVKLSFVRDENQRPIGIIGVTRDITERKQAEKELQQTLESLRKAVGATVQVMISAVESRDPYTSGHQLRSANLACAIATEMGLPSDKIEGLLMAGSIHDIGKLSIPAEILSKPNKLTKLEFSLIKEHSQKGYEMLKDVESPWPLAQIVYQHHERMDGSGYPRNLKGDEIIMEARIMAVADVVEAMASHRPYRPALGIKAALEEIEKNSGIFYDKAVADVCLRLFQEKGFQLEVT
jgi:PAS domain S-box-containing protein